MRDHQRRNDVADGSGAAAPDNRMQGPVETQVARHYAHGDLESAILDALARSGKDVDRLVADDLSPVDEFHTAGRQATVDFAAGTDFTAGMHILDVGCGIGGPSRFFATQHGCRVTGIDLTEDYVRVAEAFSRRLGLSDRVSYRQASALDLPFEPATFDGAYMMHVGMNIEDKVALFAGVRRVLKGGGVFAIFDIMRIAEGELSFPVHWAGTAHTSFVASPEHYRAALENAGFKIMRERNRRDFALDFFQQTKARIAESGLPPLGVHILMRTDVSQKIANVMSNLERGLIAPVEMFCRVRS
jgi:ubiquinone/menaquinone biosynthesis C-methylase UbiE